MSLPALLSQYPGLQGLSHKLIPRLQSGGCYWDGVNGGEGSARCLPFQKLNYWNVLFRPGLVQNPGWFFEHSRVFSKSRLGSQEELQGGGLHFCYRSLLVCLCWEGEENALSAGPVKAHRQIPIATFPKWGPLQGLVDVWRAPIPTNYFPSCCEAQLSALPVILKPWLLGNKEKIKLGIKQRHFCMLGPMLTT